MTSRKSKHYGSSALSRVLDDLVKPAFKKRGFSEHRIITDWKHIVGEVIARYSTPQKLHFPSDKQGHGVLYIDVYDSAFATEIHYLGPLILEKIATYFGYQAVERLSIQQRPMSIEPEEALAPPQQKPVDLGFLEEKLIGIEDQDLKEALKSLAINIEGSATSHPLK